MHKHRDVEHIGSLGDLMGEKVFEWCGDHGIELADLQVPAHLHKYREAVAHMYQIIGEENGDSDEPKVRKMREAIARIKSDPDRNATRAWARSRKK